MQYFLSCITQNYVGFEGRARRAEYWYFTLFLIIISIVANVIDVALGTAGIVSLIVALGFLLPSIAVAIRRLHDTERSGWWLLIAFLPLIGAIVLLVFYVLEGTKGENSYGPDPISGSSEDVFK